MHRTIKRALAIVSCLGTASALSAVASPSAAADTHQFEIAWTQIGIYPKAEPSMQASRAGAALPDGALIEVACELDGEPVDNGFGSSQVWERLSDGSYLPNAFVNTGVDGYTPGVPQCDEIVDEADSLAGGTYNRYGAASDAQRFAMTMSMLPADCTYFVSLAMWDGGGLPTTPEWTNDSPDESLWASKRLQPGTTRAAINADAFTRYMDDTGMADVSPIDWSDNTASGAQLGDVIAYDWETQGGEDGADGVIDHLAIVTQLNAEGYPFVSQHTPSQLNRYWSWSETAGDWIEWAKPGSQAYLIHITA